MVQMPCMDGNTAAASAKETGEGGGDFEWDNELVLLGLKCWQMTARMQNSQSR